MRISRGPTEKTLGHATSSGQEIAIAPPSEERSCYAAADVHNDPVATEGEATLAANLHALQACIGNPPPSAIEIAPRQHLARGLRFNPALYNWMVFWVAPGTSPRDIQPPFEGNKLEDDTEADVREEKM